MGSTKDLDVGKMSEDDPGSRGELEEALEDIRKRLEKMKGSGEITAYQQRLILEILMRVSDRLTAGFKKLREGVDDIMTGYALRTEADEILDRGIEQGQREMTGLMNYLLTHGRNEDAIRATTDKTFLKELLSQFREGLLAAR